MRDTWIDEHVGAEVRPRDGFEAELAGMLGSAWQGEVVLRSSTPGVVQRRASRRAARIAGWAAAAAVLVAGAIAFVVVERDRDADPASPIVDTVATDVPATTDLRGFTDPPQTTEPAPTVEPATTVQLPTTIDPATTIPSTNVAPVAIAATPEEQTVLDYLGALADGQWATAAKLLGEGGLEWEGRGDLRPLYADNGTLSSLPDALRRWCDSGGLCMRPTEISTSDRGHQVATFEVAGRRLTTVFAAGAFEASPMVRGLPLRVPAGVDLASIVDCTFDSTASDVADLDGDGWGELLVVHRVVDSLMLDVCGTQLRVAPLELTELPDVTAGIDVVDVGADRRDEVVVVEHGESWLGVTYAFARVVEGAFVSVSGRASSSAAAMREGRVTVGCLPAGSAPPPVVLLEYEFIGGTDITNSTTFRYTYDVLTDGDEAGSGSGEIALPAGADAAARLSIGYCGALPVHTEG